MKEGEKKQERGESKMMEIMKGGEMIKKTTIREKLKEKKKEKTENRRKK